MRVVPPGGGEVVGDAPDRRVEILADGDGVHATWSRFGPRRPGADLHVHRRHTDLFYVLDGELEVLLGPEGRPARVPAGALARVPALVVHGFRAGPGGVRYLNLPKLIELKLASGMSAAHRLKDLADVQELIRTLHLPRSAGDELDPFVRPKFFELFDAVQQAPADE